jgi:microcystin degradation protein MlrC
VELEVTIATRAETDFGRTMRLDAGSFHIAVSERSPLPIHPKFWRELDLDPRRADAIVQKNFFHYRIFYAAISLSHLPVVSDGATSLDRVRNRDYRVPTHPGTRLDDWRPYDPQLRAG